MMISSRQPPNTAALVARDRARYQASGNHARERTSCSLQSATLDRLRHRGLRIFRVLQRVRLGNRRRGSGRPSFGRRNQRPVCRLRAHSRAAGLCDQLERLPSRVPDGRAGIQSGGASTLRLMRSDVRRRRCLTTSGSQCSAPPRPQRSHKSPWWRAGHAPAIAAPG